MRKFILISFFVICPNLFINAQKVNYKKHGSSVYYVETFAIDTPFQCTKHNIIYTAGKTFVFKYQYLDKSGEEFLFKKGEDMQWEFIPKSAEDASAVHSIEMYIVSDIKEMKLAVTNQSVIHYRHLDKDKSTRAFSWDERTGLIDNKKNIWFHPPRSYLFKILELNPFPYIHLPVKEGKNWKWKLEIGAQWGDTRWKTWSNVITNKYKYKIVDTESLVETALGTLKCCKIESQAKSSIGTTYLTTYFNEQYGFVRYEYINIDKSKINIELIDIREK